MCDGYSIAYGIAAVVGAAASYAGQQQQVKEYKRANAEQEAYANAQQYLANSKRQEEQRMGEEQRQSVLDEAQDVAPTRRPQMQQAEDKQTASNVNALQQANLLGQDSIAQAAEGNQSEEYLRQRAESAGRQTDRAIKLARLFGASGAGQEAMANQMMGSINHRLDQSAIAARRNAMRSGYDWMFDNMDNERTKARAKYDPSKGMGMQALGGTMMNIGMSGLGQSMGSAAGGMKANKTTAKGAF